MPILNYNITFLKEKVFKRVNISVLASLNMSTQKHAYIYLSSEIYIRFMIYNYYMFFLIDVLKFISFKILEIKKNDL